MTRSVIGLHRVDADKAPRVPAYNGELNNPEGHMQLYTKRHRHYCGIDLHARTMHVCIVDHDGNQLVSKNIPTDPVEFLRVIAPYRDDLAVAVECIFCWYWLADLCAEHDIHFVVGHALYMRLIHGTKAKNDTLSTLPCRPNVFGIERASAGLAALVGSYAVLGSQITPHQKTEVIAAGEEPEGSWHRQELAKAASI